MDFRLLGPFEVVENGRALQIGGHRQRAVLVLLAMHVGEVVSVDEIAEEIWSGSPPSSAVQTIRSYVSRLRNVLDPQILPSRVPGYLLAVDRSCVDSFRFEERLETAGQLVSDNRYVDAARVLNEALGMWRGTALADFAYEPFAAAESQRLMERRLDAVGLRIEVDLALGRHSGVVAELEGLVCDHPLREAFSAQLMIALYRCGRQADALAQYSRLRANLVENYGLEPSPDLRRLEQLVLEQSEELDLASFGTTSDGPSHLWTDSALSWLVSRLPRSGVIGREPETSSLLAAVRDVTERMECGCAVVTGEAGIGKSTVVGQVAQQVHQEGVAVVYGRCDEDVSIPFAFLAESAAQLFEVAGEDALLALDPVHIAALAQLGSPVRAVLAVNATGYTISVGNAIEPWVLFRAIELLLRAASRRRPVMFIIEDLQWADRTTAQMIAYLIRKARGPVLFSITFRSDEIHVQHPLTDIFETIERHPNHVRIEVPGLTEEEIVAYLVKAADRRNDDASSALARAIFEETDGNAFFVQELVRHIVEIGEDEANHGRWFEEPAPGIAAFPDSVRDVIAARVARLDGAAGAILATASVIGQEFDLALLAVVVGASEPGVLESLERAETAGLVREYSVARGRFRFAHSLIQRTIYEGIRPTRRGFLHRDVYAALCERSLGGAQEGQFLAGEIARHFTACARPSERLECVDYAEAAAHEALSALNPSEAIRWYETAISHLGPDGEASLLARLTSLLGDAQRQIGDPTYRETLLAAARLALDLEETETAVFAALANSRQIQSTTGTVDDERVAVLEASLIAVGTSDSPQRARLLSHLAVDRSYDGDPARRHELMDEALSVARRTGDLPTLFDVLVRRVGVWMPTGIDERRSESGEALTVAESLEDPVALFWAWFYRSIVAAEIGDRQLLEVCRSHFPVLAEATGQPTLLWVTAYAESWQETLVGNLDQAEAMATEALELGTTTGQPDAFALFGAQILVIRWYQGRDAEVVDVVEQMCESTPEIDSFRSALARIYADLDRKDEAHRLLSAEACRDFHHPDDPLLFTTLVLWAEAAIQTDDDRAARALLSRMDDIPDHVVCNGVTALGAVTHYKGALHALLGEYDVAERLIRDALDTHTRLGAPFFEARSLLELSRTLRRRGEGGDSSSVDELIRRGLIITDRHSFPRVHRRLLEFSDR